ncbi:putative gustatory receptor clone PTE03 [Xiphophorus hellerii]|uniref:putative gustatory receptor clone PTE03 n=1 Tax=Xiphophorus hellerii TaxID=8084 RepID=UPI0013B463BA|nr:putative gustatory receptor clone PTE03 [Xiphophorus hellerii]
MLNSTSSAVVHFILGAYVDVGRWRYLCFLITAVLYLIIVAVNVLLIAVICVNRSLHEPMFLLLCSLLVNDLYGSSGLFPFLLVQILSDVHIVSAPLCFLQIFCLYSYVNTEFCNLAVMSYDRYVAICCPLQYHAVMTQHKVAVVIILTWLYSFVKFLITLLLTVRLTLCGNVLNSTFCRNYLVVNLACSDTSVNNIYGLFGTVITVLVPLLPILYSYTKILRVVLSGSKQTRQKAFNTCVPHLASLLNFSFGCLFESLQSRFDMVSIPDGLQIVMSLYFVILQSLLNPIMYGMNLTKIRKACKQLFCNSLVGDKLLA